MVRASRQYDQLFAVRGIESEYMTEVNHARERKISLMMSEASNMPTIALRPIGGANAFKHDSKLHIRATGYELRAYDWTKAFVHSQCLAEA